MGRSSAYARWLFGTAAALNIAVVILFLAFPPMMVLLVGFRPGPPINMTLGYLVGSFILLFGYAYVLIARDSVRYRPYIHLAAIGKLMAVGCVALSWLQGYVQAQSLVLISPDLIYAVLFFLYLGRTPATA